MQNSHFADPFQGDNYDLKKVIYNTENGENTAAGDAEEAVRVYFNNKTQQVAAIVGANQGILNATTMHIMYSWLFQNTPKGSCFISYVPPDAQAQANLLTVMSRRSDQLFEHFCVIVIVADQGFVKALTQMIRRIKGGKATDKVQYADNIPDAEAICGNCE